MPIKVLKQKRLLYAKGQQSWIQDSNESRFELHLANTGTKVIRTRNQAFHTDCLKCTVNFPSSVRMWGCMSANGIGKMCFIQNTVNAARYINILEENLIPFAPHITTFDEYALQ